MSDFFGALVEGATKLTGQAIDWHEQRKQQIRAENLQREFAQQGIRWKVEDAKAAGIHPLFALGASTASASPVVVGSNFTGALGDMGQDISRAINATRTAEERRTAEEDAFFDNAVKASDARVAGAQAAAAQAEAVARQKQMFDVDMENAHLRNQLLSAQIAKLKAAPNPPFPSGGSSSAATGISPRELTEVVGPGPYSLSGGKVKGGSGIVPPSGALSLKPSEVISSEPGNREREAGSKPGFVRYRTAAGDVDLPGQALSESIEALPHGAGGVLVMANELGKFLKGRDKPSESLLPKGFRWDWSVWSQSWKAVPTR